MSATLVVENPLKADENQVLDEFLNHEAKCSRCKNAINGSRGLDWGSKIYLCRRGWDYAYTLHTYIYRRRGLFYSDAYPKYFMRGDRKCIRVLEMPEYSRSACRLLKALEYGVCIRRVRRNVDENWDDSARFGDEYDDGRRGSIYKKSEMYREYGPVDAPYMYKK